MLSTGVEAARGVEVWVETEDGKRLNEYEYTGKTEQGEDEEEDKADSDNAPRQVCWLETPEKADAIFRVCYTLPKDERTRRVQLYIEGARIAGYRHSVEKHAKGSFRTMVKTTPDGAYEYKLAFSNLITTDSPRGLQDFERCKNLGQITVVVDEGRTEKVWRSASYGNAPERRSHGQSRDTLTPDSVYEKLKKRADRAVTGVKGKPVPSPRNTPGGFTDEYRKDETKGEHRLTFRYASRSFLIARGIIEKDPEVKAQDEAQAKADKDRKAEARAKKRLQNRINDLQRELARLQAEAEDPDIKPELGINVHDLGDKRKRGRETSPIDLVDED